MISRAVKAGLTMTTSAPSSMSSGFPAWLRGVGSGHLIGLSVPERRARNRPRRGKAHKSRWKTWRHNSGWGSWKSPSGPKPSGSPRYARPSCPTGPPCPLPPSHGKGQFFEAVPGSCRCPRPCPPKFRNGRGMCIRRRRHP